MGEESAGRPSRDTCRKVRRRPLSGSSETSGRGPPGARVKDVEVEDMPPTGAGLGFLISSRAHSHFIRQRSNQDGTAQGEDSTRPRFPEGRDIVLRHHDAPAGRRRAPRSHRCDRCAIQEPGRSTSSSASKAEGSFLARRWRTASAPVSRRSENPASCRPRPSAKPTHSSTAAMPWKSIAMP